jgi:hypothetical protein
MDTQHFDRLTKSLRDGSHRRQVIAGLVAGTTMLFGQATGARAQKHRKICKFCPQRACCSCKNAQGPTKCAQIEASNRDDILHACDSFCGADVINVLNFAVPTVANSCGADLTCKVQTCPIRVGA